MLLLACTAPATDGACDEPAAVPYGEDADCDAACASDPDAFPGPCAHRAQRDAPAREVGPGSGGSGGSSGTWDGVVTVPDGDGDPVDRHFRVYVPESADPSVPAGLIFVLGGFRTDLYGLAEYTGMNAAADLGGFLVVYGEGEWRDYTGWVWVWYVYNRDFDGGWDQNPDLVYLSTIADTLFGLYEIDLSRVFVAGHSRGAALSVIAAYERPDLFAGFAAQSGFVATNGYDTRALDLDTPPGRAFVVHGTDDTDVPVEEGDAIAALLDETGWDYEYLRLEGVTHEWQPQYDPQLWSFLAR
ncbi:MAG: alpha/beta hydrolase family esterase [Myxococcota bacterium]